MAQRIYKTKTGSGFNRRLLSMAILTRLTRDDWGLNTTAFKEIVQNKLVTIGRSEAAEEADVPTTKDHIVPNLVLVTKAREMWERGIESKENYHKIKKNIARLYKCCGKVVIITKEEDARLTQIGLKQKMPDDWGASDEDWSKKNIFARYPKAGIKIKLI
jgi:hypothetical protein